MRRNGPAALALPATALMATVWLAVACAIGGTNGSTPVPSPAAAGTSAAPVLTIQPPAAVITPPTTTAVPIGTSTDLAGAQPPAGSLAEGGAPVEGLLGSYCWTAEGIKQCVDSVAFTDSGPDLPSLTVVSASGQLHFSLAGNYPFASWSASYIDDDGNVVPLGSNGASFDPDAVQPSVAQVTEASFNEPAAHDQSIVQIFVRFADGGDASYGWNVTVP